MTDEFAKRAIRNYRGPNDPSPFMAIINSLSFQCRNMQRGGANVQSLTKLVRGGKVNVMRVGDVEYVTTEGVGARNLLLLYRNNSTTSADIYIFDVATGSLIRKITLTTEVAVGGGFITGADPTQIRWFDYMDHSTPTYYYKFDYAGNQLDFEEYNAGEINAASGYKEYDLYTLFDNPDPLDLPNVQHNLLYRNGTYVGGVSFSSTPTHLQYASEVAFTDDAIYMNMVDTDYAPYANWLECVLKFDFEMNLIAGPLWFCSPLISDAAVGLCASDLRVGWGYQIWPYATQCWIDLTNGFTFSEPYNVSYRIQVPVGMIDNDFYVWYRNYYVPSDYSMTLARYTIAEGGIVTEDLGIFIDSDVELWASGSGTIAKGVAL